MYVCHDVYTSHLMNFLKICNSSSFHDCLFGVNSVYSKLIDLLFNDSKYVSPSIDSLYEALNRDW